MKRAMCAACIGVVMAAPCSLDAQAAEKSVDVGKIVQFATPATPALSFIGSSSEKIARPVSAKELMAQVSNAIQENGKVAQGFTIEVAPYQLLWKNMDAAEYRERLPFILANTTLSVASAKVSGDFSATNIGFGVRVVLFDRSDPMTAAGGGDAVLDALGACGYETHPLPAAGAELETFRRCFVSQDSAFHARFRREHWNDWALAVSAARGMQLGDSEWERRESMGWGASSVVAAPLCFRSGVSGGCSRGQWLAQVSYERRDSVAEAPAPARTLSYGARLTIGSANVGVFAEVLGARITTRGANQTKKNVTNWSGGIEFKVSENLWATTGAGTRYAEAVGETKVVVLAGLRVRLTDGPKLRQLIPGG